MKKIVIGLATAVLLGVGGFSYKVYDNYQTREKKINHVLAFQKVAYGAYTMLVSGNYKEAVKLYGKAVAMHDKDAKTLLDYSDALAHIGESKKSVEMFEKAYQNANYKNEDVLAQLASMNYKINNYERSEHYYKEAIDRFRPKYRYIEKVILSLDKQGKTDEAMAYFAYIQEKSPEYFKDKKEFEKFSKLYTPETKALNLLPKYDITEDEDELLALGAEYEKRGLDDKALRAYDKVLFSNPENQKANRYAADLMLRYGDYSHALEHLSKLKIEDFDVLMKKASVFQELKKYNMAIVYYEKALKKEQNALLYKNLAACSFRSGDKDKTLKYLSQLKNLDPRMAYNFEYMTLVSLGEEMSREDKLKYQALNTWYDLQDFFSSEPGS